MSKPDDPNLPKVDPTAADPTAGARSTGGQQPSDPRSDQTAAEAVAPIRERLRSPGRPAGDSHGKDTRGSDVSGSDFRQTDSRRALSSHGRDERQLAQDSTPVPATIDRQTDPFELSRQKSSERLVAGLFLLSFLGTVGFVLTYFLVNHEFEAAGWTLYTPLLGLTMAAALGGIGAGAVVWAKNLMDDEESTQERYPFGSSPEDQEATGTAIKAGLAETQLPRRSLLRNTLLLSGGALAILPLPLVFSLGPYQHKERKLRNTGWVEGARLIRQNGTPVNRDDLEIGSIVPVFPDVPRGTKLADSAALLIRMRPDELHLAPEREAWAVDGYVCYSAICTHLGCPVKLYQVQTHNLVCPCHQSLFEADNGAAVNFGPAARPLPQLAIFADDEGYFRAQGDFTEPVGPSFWERS